MKENEHLLIVDGMALLFRSFYATAVTGQFMINSKGMPTNGVQGYIKHLLTAVEKIQPTHIAVCWDMGGNTFRNDLFPDYKSNREAPPVELIPQFDLAKKATDFFQLPNIGVEGFEADDCIGTIAKREHPKKVTILSGDRDLLQLLDEHIDVMLLKKGYGNYAFYTYERFYEEYGVTPQQFIDVKALMGDPSDGYPGVKGIGEKTALKLIQQFGSIEGILENLSLLSPSQKKKIEEDLDMLYLSRKLATIHCDAPISWNKEQARWEPFLDSIMECIEQFEFKTLKPLLFRWNESQSARLLSNER
ncbi:5'-3' exonuclease [Bacillus smithii]|uniref:5'-3' exonuclease n=1 Tax=Bacillus smithii TaxID=1479 RepID=UPI002E20DB5F|nr:5'-3' exonuclease H3TH domain-containing protein [Bacillus smithii]